jgi:hypothetical protein
MFSLAFSLRNLCVAAPALCVIGSGPAHREKAYRRALPTQCTPARADFNFEK